MCTGLNLVTENGEHIFGRSLDVICNYTESINIVPRNFKWLNVVDNNKLGTVNICSGSINGKTNDVINKGNGYVYYKNSNIFKNNSLKDTVNDPSHIILKSDLICEAK